MKYLIPTLFVCIPLAAGLPLPGGAAAATWQWSSGSGREQITIVPDAPPTRAETRRTGEQHLTVTLTPPPRHLDRRGAGPAPQSLFGGLTLDNGRLTLHTNSPAFGFIAGRPTDGGLTIVLYPDPLGLRWRPDGGLAPAPPEGETPLPPTTSSPPSTAREPASPAPPPVSATSDLAAASPGPLPEAGQATASVSAVSVPQVVPSPAVARGETSDPPPDSPADTAAPTLSVPAADDPMPVETGPEPVAPPSYVAAPPPAGTGSAAVPAERTEVAEPSDPTDPATAETEPAPRNIAPSVAPAPVPRADPSPPEAAALSPVDAPDLSTRPAAETPDAVLPVVRGRLNRSGPEAWPEDRALASTPTAPVSPPGPGSVSPSSSPAAVPAPPETTDTASVSGETPSPSDRPGSEGPVADTLPSQTGKLATRPPEHLDNDDPARSGPEDAAPAPTEEETAETAPIYVDEEGNPVPPPPDVPALLAALRAAMKDGRHQDVLASVHALRPLELSREDREEMLYDAMTALYESNRPDFMPRSQDIIDAANEAMNFNLASPRVPDALAVLATVNLALGNVEDARGYVQLMRRKYPDTPHVPSSMLELGSRQMERQEYAEAALSFQTILQEYPDSPTAKDAARLETYALYRQGHMDRALTLVDFVERRWPRLYLEDPDYLAVSADIRFKQGHLEDALRTYWTQYNLEPAKPESASTLQHIAETYYLLRNPDAAAKVLDELVRAFPLSPEAPVALLRLGENGIHEGNPTVDELFALFEAPNPRLPGLYYQRIIKDYPQAPEVATAQLRTIAWQMWNKEYFAAMTAARGFLIDYADKPESLRARALLLRGFAHELALSLQEENYERVLRLWDDFPQVHEEYLPLEPDMRMALARARLNRGDQKEGLDLLAPFLDGPGDTDYAHYAYNLYLATYLREQNWDAILSLGEKVASWPLPGEARRQLDYALALSAENLGLPSRALPLWRKLADRTDIPLYQRAYATYFLARDAEIRQDLRDAYQYNLDTLGMFTQLQDEQSPYADQERVRESIAALMDVTEIAGRYAEALEWANRYALFVPETSPDYAGLQFREAGLHRKMGDMARWRALLQSIVDREPDSVFGKMAASELRTQDVARDLTRFTGN